VPLKVALGRSGFIPHAAFAVLVSPLVLPRGEALDLGAFVLAWVMASVALSLIGGARRRPAAVALATVLAFVTCASCVGVSYAFLLAMPRLVPEVRTWVVPEVELAVAAFVGAFLFGTYLALLTMLGWENTQAFTALDHPGFKHFVRLRIRRDGSGIDGYCIGLVDPVRAAAERSKDGWKPLLVDRFTWKSRR